MTNNSLVDSLTREYEAEGRKHTEALRDARKKILRRVPDELACDSNGKLKPKISEALDLVSHLSDVPLSDRENGFWAVDIPVGPGAFSGTAFSIWLGSAERGTTSTEGVYWEVFGSIHLLDAKDMEWLPSVLSDSCDWSLSDPYKNVPLKYVDEILNERDCFFPTDGEYTAAFVTLFCSADNFSYKDSVSRFIDMRNKDVKQVAAEIDEFTKKNYQGYVS